MMDKLFIPKTISVGYQKRGDTYNDLLGYVIYTDDKGVLRKETSWQSWRDNKIDPKTFDNKPTNGFVLNKGVGGGGQGWDSRQSKIRIYDPRGHEFEITIANLLFILQEYTSAKGKAIDGEFVYAWEGKDLVLLPTECLEYKESVKFSVLQGKKVSAKDLIVGATYITKQDTELVYLGRFVYYNSDYKYVYDRNMYNSNYTPPDTKYNIIGRKKHIFFDSKYKKFVPLTSMDKLAKVGNETVVDDYAELVDNFLLTKHASAPIGIKGIKNKELDIKKIQSSYRNNFLDVGGRYVSTYLENVYIDYNKPLGYKLKFETQYLLEGNTIIEKKVRGLDPSIELPNIKLSQVIEKGRSTWDRDKTLFFYTEEELKKLDWYELRMVTESGKDFKITEYQNL